MTARPTRQAVRVREAVRARVAEGLRDGVFPGAVVAVVRGKDWLLHQAFGDAQVVPRRRPMTIETVFDLASLTKPLATATAVLQLWERGAVDLDAPVAAYIPRFAWGGKADATVRHLLAHTAGLPAWEMLYLTIARPSGGRLVRAGACRSIEGAAARICATPALAPPGSRVEYSDLGFILLGYLVERLTGMSLNAYARERIFGPLGLGATRFSPPRAWRTRCAATEVGNGYERMKACEQGLGRGFAWRTHLLRGEVHDGNAWHLGRGVAGHAGLFATAGDVARFGAAMLRGGAIDGARVLRPATVAEATRDQTGQPGPGRRGLGWSLQGGPSAGAPSAGTRASMQAYCHTGFTGTSLLVDPARDLVVVLLTNRVHPTAQREEIQAFRPAFHDAVIEALDG
ncbi:MAG: serine hydrolase domain-containing protein [bacterium]|nr:serine hydrolase domain-containing protein [bacterium]